MTDRLSNVQKSIRLVAEDIRRDKVRGYKLGPTDKFTAVIGAGRGKTPEENCTESETATMNWIGLALKRCWDRQSAGAWICQWSIDKVARAVHDLMGEAGELERDEVCDLVDRYAIRCWDR